MQSCNLWVVTSLDSGMASLVVLTIERSLWVPVSFQSLRPGHFPPPAQAQGHVDPTLGGWKPGFSAGCHEALSPANSAWLSLSFPICKLEMQIR